VHNVLVGLATEKQSVENAQLHSGTNFFQGQLFNAQRK